MQFEGKKHPNLHINRPNDELHQYLATAKIHKNPNIPENEKGTRLLSNTLVTENPRRKNLYSEKLFAWTALLTT